MENPPPYTSLETKVHYVPPGTAPQNVMQHVHPQAFPSNVGPSGNTLEPRPYESQQVQFINYPPRPANTFAVNPPLITQTVGPHSQFVSCPSCRYTCATTVETKASSFTHCMAIFMCLCLCWICAPLPYCMDSCQNKDHYCSNCGAYIGTYAG